MALRSVNPATGELLREYPEQSEEDVERLLAAARAAVPKWRSTPLDDRADMLDDAAEELDRDVEAHARQITAETGKPIREARAEVNKCVRGLRWCVDHAAEALEPRAIDDRTRVVYEPLGVVLGVMPWNFPYWQVVRFAAPALLAGNAVLVKHASNVTGCLLSLEAAFRDGGVEDAFQALRIPSSRVEAVVRDPRVSAVSVTGSERAGRSVARAAGDTLKPAVLELGGSDPFIVFADADVGKAARQAARARTVNAGQSCIAAKRFLVEAAAYDDFLAAFVEAMRGLKVGDPLEKETDVGPLAKESVRTTLREQVDETVKAGARVLLGGGVRDGPGLFFEPTVLADVPAGSPVLTDEVFGPVAPVLRFEDEDEAVRLANATRYGLGASVWTPDRERAARFAARLEAGMVFLNAIVQSDPKAPFGGVKASGFGRELGFEGFRAFTNAKTVVARG